MDTRRQSGLWNRNPQTGFYEQVAPPTQAAPSGPYQYYQPPPRQAMNDRKGRSFSERAADISLDEDGMQRSDSKRQHDALHASAQAAAAPIKEIMASYPESISAHLAQTQHVNSTDLPGSSQQQPFDIDPDFVPTNLRAQAWSPDPSSQRPPPPQSQPQSQSQRQVSQSKPRQASNASNTSAILRRDSVPHRSPLQNLESWSKEEKRARVQEAESRARAKSLAGSGRDNLSRHGTVSSGKGRVVSDGAAREMRLQTLDRGQMEQGASDSPISPLSGGERFKQATEALRRETTPHNAQSPVEGQRRNGSNTKASRHRRSPAIANNAQPYRHSPANPTDGSTAAIDSRRNRQSDRLPTDLADDAPEAGWSPKPTSDSHRLSADLGRPRGDDYRNRARNTGFTGALAAASAGAGFAAADSAAQRGKAAYERRKSQIQADNSSDVKGRTTNELSSSAAPSEMDQLHTDRMGRANSKRARQAVADDVHDPIRRNQVENPKSNPVRFSIPPQTAAGEDMAQQVLSGPDGIAHRPGQHRIRDMFHHDGRQRRSYQASSNPLEEWRKADTARLTIRDLEFEQTIAAKAEAAAEAAAAEDKDAAWWEKGHRRASSSGHKQQRDVLAQYEGPYEEQANGFQPRLFLRCGPLLRFTGIHKETSSQPRSDPRGEKEVWRGTVMIVTEDDPSDLSSTPVLRLFAQPMDLFPTPPRHRSDDAHNAPSEHQDPVTGQVKLSRTGRALYVRSVHEIDGDVDLSLKENPEGLFAPVHTPALAPKSTARLDQRDTYNVRPQDRNRINNRDGEKARRIREVKAVRLHSERGWTFWRFNLEVELGSKQYRVAYRINRGPAIGFWVPAKGETMNIMFHSCNGFSRSVDPHQFSGPDPLWRDVLNRHQSRPFHVMIGGGDQIYNDIVAEEAPLFREWLGTSNSEHKYKAEFTEAMQDELESFYLRRYAMWFSQGLFAMANSQIPMVNIWDDHDIIDGYGSYPDSYMRTLIFSGLGAVAYKYYMLFQHQSLITETTKDESSWLLGESPGPYINEVSRSVFLHLGRKVAFLGLDCRTERMWDEVLSQRTYDIVFERCRREIAKGQTNHLIVLLGVPIAYPRLNFLENILTSRAMEPIKAIGRTGILGGFINKFDGGVEILDDLNDHWTARHHKAERNWFIQELQELAAEKSVRITILGGDVHLGAIGQFYTPKKMLISKDHDHKYMPNIVSSAIVNTPPPTMMADVLNRRNKVHHLDGDTDEDMIPMFSHDVDGSRRNNMRLLPRRNYCTIREYHPGTTPPPTPPPESEPVTPARENMAANDSSGPIGRRFPPGSMNRTMSLTRGTANLVRRLSNSSRKRPPVPLAPEHAKPYGSLGQNGQGPLQRANSVGGPRPDDVSSPIRPTNTFHRRPTDLSVKDARKAAAKTGTSGTLDGREPGHIDLEGGLDISLNMEIDQHDPSGATVPYRLLVPALWYDGPSDPNPHRFKSHRASLMNRLRGFRRREMPMDGPNDASDYDDQGSRISSPMPAQRPAERAPPEETMGLTSTGRGAVKPPRRPDPRSDSDEDFSSDDDHDHESVHDPSSAYHKGYNLASPPLGPTSSRPPQQAPTRSASARHPPAPQANAGANRTGVGNDDRTTFQPGHRRRVSAPVTSSTRAPPADAYADDFSDDSDFDDDDDDDDDMQSTAGNLAGTDYPPGLRKGSKAERFLGIGDSDGPPSSGGGLGGVGGGAAAGGVRRGGSLQLHRDAGERSAPAIGRSASLRQRLGFKSRRS